MPGFGVAKAAGFRNSRPSCVDERIHARNEIRPPHVARVAAIRRVDHRRPAGRRVVEHVAGGIDVDHVRTRDADVNRQAAARVDDAADVPAAEDASATPSATCSRPAAVRNLVERAEVERMADVEGVVAECRSRNPRASARALPTVSASFDPLVLPKLRDSVYCAFNDRPLDGPARQPELQRVVVVVAAARLRVDFGVRILHAGDGCRPHRAGTIENWRMTNAALAGFGFVTTATIGLAMLRRNRLRPCDADVGRRQATMCRRDPAAPSRCTARSARESCTRSDTRAAGRCGCSGC